MMIEGNYERTGYPHRVRQGHVREGGRDDASTTAQIALNISQGGRGW